MVRIINFRPSEHVFRTVTKLTTFWRGNVLEGSKLNDCENNGRLNLELILVKWVASWKIWDISQDSILADFGVSHFEIPDSAIIALNWIMTITAKPHNSVAHICQLFTSHLKLLGFTIVIWNTFHPADPKLLGVTARNLISRATGCPERGHFSYILPNGAWKYLHPCMFFHSRE